MFYQSQLDLLCKTFEKLRINTQVISIKEIKQMQKDLASNQEQNLDINKLFNLQLFSILENIIKEKEIFITTNSFKLKNIVLLLPTENSSKEDLFIIGPYVNTPITNEKFLEIAEKNNLSSSNLTVFQNFVSVVPTIDKDSLIFTLLETFCESLWQGKGFSYKEVSKNHSHNHLNFSYSSLIDQAKSFEETNLKILERTYQAENDMMEMISSGKLSKIKNLVSNFRENAMEKRLSDTLRNLKNYAIISNTLMRKAAEKGGVHPYYLNQTSSAFAKNIERCLSENQCVELIKEMFISYCRLVQDYSTKDYSPIVQKTIFYITNNLSERLTLSTIADKQNVSKGYLSAVFRKETGKTLTDFIIEKRIQYAGHLISSTNLKLQSVAINCGILDMQYFAKLFKKIMGVSPNKYRKQFSK
jgi:YesN/AraC family two-component response regulator